MKIGTWMFLGLSLNKSVTIETLENGWMQVTNCLKYEELPYNTTSKLINTARPEIGSNAGLVIRIIYRSPWQLQVVHICAVFFFAHKNCFDPPLSFSLVRPLWTIHQHLSLDGKKPKPNEKSKALHTSLVTISTCFLAATYIINHIRETHTIKQVLSSRWFYNHEYICHSITYATWFYNHE